MSDAGGDGNNGDSVPYYLMPVAAVLGTYAVIASFRALYQAYQNFKYNPQTATAKQRLNAPKPIKSSQFAFLIISIVISIVGYGYVCALVNNSITSSTVFDPYDILAVDPSSDSAAIKSAYRALSKIHHPDKGGDTKIFQKINLAYKALSDEVARSNFEKYGHPDGPQTQTLSFALPDWLLHPEGKVAAVLVLLYLAMFVGIAIYAIRYVQAADNKASKAAMDTSVSAADPAYLASHLSPTSTHLDVLYLIATTPESISITSKNIAKAEELRKEKLKLLKKRNPKKKESNEFDFDDGGEWADDNEEDEAAKVAAEAAKKAEEEKRLAAAQLANATGKSNEPANIKMEGIDDGVLGQKWVEDSLKPLKMWPPPNMNVLEKQTFLDTADGKVKSALDHPAVRRNLCMTMGRLNSNMLNSHPDLVAAGQKQLIDPTYFKSTLEFRQRTGLLLEAALRVAMSARSYRLAKTIIETVSIFKVGVFDSKDQKTLEWFDEIMKKQYGEDGLPRLVFHEKGVETPGEDEIATDDVCSLKLKIERPHAEPFTKQKIEMCKKQGIPPQIAMQTYREGWWVLVRAKRIGQDEEADAKLKEAAKTRAEETLAKNPLLQALEAGSQKRLFEEEEENTLSCAWPFIVSNVAQKTGNVQVKFKAPAVPGKYQFLINVKSQEFLGADQEFTLEAEVLDKEDVEREEDESDEDEDSGDEENDEEDDDDSDDEDDDEEEESKKDK